MHLLKVVIRIEYKLLVNIMNVYVPVLINDLEYALCTTGRNFVDLNTYTSTYEIVLIAFLYLFPSIRRFLSADNLFKQLDPDQTRRFVGSDLDPNCLTRWWYS